MKNLIKDLHRFVSASKLVAVAAALCSCTVFWTLAQDKQAPVPVGSSLDMGGQVVAPANSTTLNSTFSVSGDDEVKWITYLQSRLGSPFEAMGESTFLEANTPSTNFKWIKGKLLLPPKTSFEWFVNGSGWTNAEPATGTVVTKVRWKMDPQHKVEFGVISESKDFSGTGDGFRIIPYKDRLYVINHHISTRYFNCRMASSDSTCPGFPSDKGGVGLSGVSGAAASVANNKYYTIHTPMEAVNYENGRLYIAMHRLSDNGLDIVCVNLDTLVSCGATSLGVFPNPGSGNNLSTELIGDKYYTLSSTGKLFCFNIKTEALCGVTDYDIRHGQSGYYAPGTYGTSTQLDGKLFFANSNRVYCHNPSTESPCPGWSTSGVTSNIGVFPILNSDGTARGVCDRTGSTCYAMDGTSFLPSANAQSYIANNRFWAGYSFNAGAIYGSKIYTGRNSTWGLNCFDFATDNICVGFPAKTTVNGAFYSTRFSPLNPRCFLALGDYAQGVLFDIETLKACTFGNKAEEPQTIDIEPAQYYRCDANQATVSSWDSVRLSQTIGWNVPGGLKSVKVTLQDANGAELPPLYQPVRYVTPGQYSVSIEDVPFKDYQRLKVVVQMTGVGGLNSNSDLGIDVTWKGDPIQLCFQTKAPKDPGCPTSVDTTVTLAKFENPDQVFDETVAGIKSLWPGVPNTGYAAVSAATSPRSVLNDNVAGKDGRTRILQGRYNMQTFTGDLWSFDLDASGNVDQASKQSAERTLTPSLSRPVFSARPGTGRPGSMDAYKLSWANASNAQQTVLNTNRQGVLDGRGNDRVNFLFGFNGPFRVRSANLGPVVNSGPVVLSRNTMPSLPENLFKDYSKYRSGTIAKKLPPLALWGGNDGALHAFTFEGGQLKEAWTFVSDVMLKQTSRLTDSTLAESLASPHYVDAIPMVGHADLNGSAQDGWTPVAVKTYGKGARAITALDISNNDLSRGSGVLFEYTNATLGDPARSEGVSDLVDLGHIISQPAYDETLGAHQIVRVKDGSSRRWAVLLGNGVNSHVAEDGSPSGTGRPVLYAFYLDNPSPTAPRWRRIDVQSATGINNEPDLTDKNGLSSPRPVDTDGDGDVDVAYAGDIHGNLWRFDLSDLADAGNKDKGRVTRLFQTIGKQPIYTVPVAVRNTVAGACASDKVRKCWQVTFGSGHYFSPIELDLAANLPGQYLYGVLDKGDKSTVDVGQLLENKFETPAQRPASDIDFRTVSAQKIDYAKTHRGWYMALGVSEHLVGATKLQPTGLAMYPVVQPGKKSSSSASCAPAQSWLIELNPTTGAPVGYTFDINGDGRIDSADVFPNGGKVPAAMAVSGNQFGPPAILLDSSTGSQSMSLVLPSAGQDTRAPNSYGAVGPNAGKPDMAKHADRKNLGRMAWREVY